MFRIITIFLINILDRYIHQKRLQKIFLKIEDDIKIILDIGCHVGEYSVLFKQVFKNSYIHAFEPNISLKSIIEKKFMLKKNFDINYVAVSDIDGELRMIIDKEISKISTASKINYESNTFKAKKILYSSNKDKDLKNITSVKSIKIDSYLNKNNLNADFVKIDVEGLELIVLMGFKKNIVNTRYIMIEHHKDDLYNDVNSEDVFDFLRNNNFEILYSLKFPLLVEYL